MDCNSRSATVQCYATSINKLFEMRGFPIPANVSDKDNMVTKIIHASEHEETIARQQSPITIEMYVAMVKLAKESAADSAETVVFQFFNLIRLMALDLLSMPKPRRQKSMSLNMPLEIKSLRLSYPPIGNFMMGNEGL